MNTHVWTSENSAAEPSALDALVAGNTKAAEELALLRMRALSKEIDKCELELLRSKAQAYDADQSGIEARAVMAEELNELRAILGEDDVEECGEECEGCDDCEEEEEDEEGEELFVIEFEFDESAEVARLREENEWLRKMMGIFLSNKP